MIFEFPRFAHLFSWPWLSFPLCCYSYFSFFTRCDYHILSHLKFHSAEISHCVKCVGHAWLLRPFLCFRQPPMPPALAHACLTHVVHIDSGTLFFAFSHCLTTPLSPQQFIHKLHISPVPPPSIDSLHLLSKSMHLKLASMLWKLMSPGCRLRDRHQQLLPCWRQWFLPFCSAL